MITDELFGLQAETLKYFDRSNTSLDSGYTKALIKLAITECLYAGRIIALLGGERQTKQILNVAALIRSIPQHKLGQLRAVYAVNRDFNILLAEKHFGSRRGKSGSMAANRKIDALFAEIVHTNDIALNRLKKLAAG